MSAADFQGLSVYLVLGGALVVLMLWISARRSHSAAAGFTMAALAASLAAVGFSAEVAPREITPLLVIDGYGLYLSVLFLAAAFVVALIAPRCLAGKPRPGNPGSRDDPEEFYLLLLCATLGAVTLAGANHFASLLLGLEILSIALYVLVAYPQAGHPPLEAALKYLILSGAASTTMLFGMALVYVATGSLAFVPPTGAAGGEIYLTVGVVMILAGAAFKLSLVPFHMWTPDVYQGAPIPVTAYLATVSKGAVFGVILRYLIEADLMGTAAVDGVLLALAVLSMLIGNLLALTQQHIKRVLAYSAIAHLGYLLIPLITLGPTDPVLAAEASLVYLGAYFVMTLAAFTAVAVLSGPADEADSLTRYEGLFWRRPPIAAVLTVALLSLAGIPLTVGFIAKFYVFAAGVTAAAWVLLAALIIGSGIGLYYYLRIVFVMTRSGAGAGQRLPATSASGGLALGVLGAMLLLLGVYPTPFIHAVRQALSSWSG